LVTLVAWTEEARRALYVRRYGEDAGAEKFEEWQAKAESRDEPLQQAGSNVAGERAPKRTPRKSSKVDKEAMATGIAALIAVSDVGLAELSPKWASVPRLTGSEELLQKLVADTFGGGNEIERLAAAIADVVHGNEWLTSVLASAKKSSGSLKLLAVIGAILVPRLIAAGIIPSPFGGPADVPADVESGGTHGDRGDDGLGQVGPDVAPVADTTPLHSVEVQSGFGTLPGSAASLNGRRDARPETFAPRAASEV